MELHPLQNHHRQVQVPNRNDDPSLVYSSTMTYIADCAASHVVGDKRTTGSYLHLQEMTETCIIQCVVGNNGCLRMPL